MPRKKIAKTSRRKKAESVSQTVVVSEKPQGESFGSLVKRKYLSIGIGIAFILLVLFLLKSVFIAAIVNGQPVWRIPLIRNLEKQGGKQVLNSLITNMLIYQEAKKKNITIGNDEIQKQIKSIEARVSSQGSQNLDEVLKTQGMTRKELEEQIKFQKTVEKLINKKVDVTDQEVQDYIDKNKESTPEEANMNEVKTSVKQQLLQEKSQNAYQELVENLKKQAKIQYLVNY